MGHSLRARVLTPVDAATCRYVDDCVVHIDDDGRIAAIGPGGAADRDLRPGVLLPGFVDSHVHYPQTRIIGAASGPLLQWLERSTFPEEARFADPAHAAAVAEVFCTALASAGTTLSMVYGSVHRSSAEILFSALDRRGLKALAGPVLMDANCPAELVVPVGPAMDAVEALVERWHGRDGRLEVCVAPRFALSCSRQMLAAAGEASRRLGLFATTHLAENLDECRLARERFGAADYLQVYEDAGLVHDRSVFAHCVHLSGAEWDRFAAAGAVVAHCPDSNFFLGSGRMPVDAVRGRGIPLAIGTDVAAGRTFRIPRVLSSAFDNALASGSAVSTAELLYWGTRGGALALGRPETGWIQPGADADLVAIDVPDWAETAEDVIAWTLFAADAPMPRETWVRGRTVWRRPGGGYPWGVD